MSGTVVEGLGKGLAFNKSIIDGWGLSGFQYDSIDMDSCVDIKGFNDNKVLTDTQLKKYGVLDAYDLVEEYHPDKYKYHILGVRLGVTRFVKYKADYKKNLNIKVLPKRAGVVQKGYTVVSTHYKGKQYGNIINTFSTLTEAKQYAQKVLINNQYISNIYKNYKKDWTVIDKVHIGTMQFTETSEMKSRSSKQPKSYIILPEYLFAYAGRCSDAEYEYM